MAVGAKTLGAACISIEAPGAVVNTETAANHEVIFQRPDESDMGKNDVIDCVPRFVRPLWAADYIAPLVLVTGLMMLGSKSPHPVRDPCHPAGSDSAARGSSAKSRSP